MQTYIINQAKVIFLNPRPHSKLSHPGATDACQTCNRCLRDGCSFCSLSCKVGEEHSKGPLQLNASQMHECNAMCIDAVIMYMALGMMTVAVHMLPAHLMVNSDGVIECLDSSCVQAMRGAVST